MVNTVYNEALSDQNTIVIGGKFAGKKTLLMQLSLKVDSKNKLYIEEPISKEEANFIVSKLNDTDTWIFCEKGYLDIEGLYVLSKVKNIKVISIIEDYAFESSKHILDAISYKKIEIGELDQSEAESIYSHIPPNIRKSNFSYKEVPNEKYSMLELISKNVIGVLNKERIASILLSINDKNKKAIQTIALTTYLVSCDSALSTDVLFSFFNIKSYDEIKSIISSVNSILNEFNITIREVECNKENRAFFLLSKF